ncbi:MAG: YggU family protein [Phycisphaerae bacterium]|nr:YggU family protein [Phycisphaerae bacterium]
MSRIGEAAAFRMFKEVPDGVEVRVKVVPGSTRTKIVGRLGDDLKVAVSAPPEKGKANQALTRFLADRLGLGKNEVQVISGQNNPRKTLLIRGVSMEYCKQKLLADG